MIRGFCCCHDQNSDKFCAIFNSLRALFVNYQRNDITNDDYLKEFQACISSLDDLNANILSDIPCLLEDEVEIMYSRAMDAANEEELKNARKLLQQKTAGRLLLI